MPMLEPGQTGAKDRDTILVVDDTPANLTVLGQLLSPRYQVKVAPSGERGLAIATAEPHPDLVLLDIMMPDLDGYEVLRRLRRHPTACDVPVIFVTSMNAVTDEEQGLRLGAVDYITKPISPAIVLARVATHLEVKHARDWLRDQNQLLESEVARRMRHNQQIQDVSIRALASLAEARDLDTGNHIRRTQAYVEVLAQALRDHPRFSHYLTDAVIRMIVKSAPLHDIGKVGIPDQILRKPGRLDNAEFEQMKQHSRIGGDAIETALRGELSDDQYTALQRHCHLGGSALDQAMNELEQMPLGFLRIAQDIARHHHERWDGSGYPDGLAGESIPIPARLMALADAFDALINRRIYKPAMAVDEAVDLILAGRGSHFDPDVVDAFVTELDHFRAIAARHPEETPGASNFDAPSRDAPPTDRAD
jgi:putative two-component system response regulator